MSENFNAFLGLVAIAVIAWLVYEVGHDRGYEQGRARYDMIFERGEGVGRDDAAFTMCKHLKADAESYRQHVPEQSKVLDPFVRRFVARECAI